VNYRLKKKLLECRKGLMEKNCRTSKKYYEMLELRNELKEKNWCNKQLGKEWKIAC